MGQRHELSVRDARHALFIDRKKQDPRVEFDRQDPRGVGLVPPAVNPVLWNLFDSHDTDRLANMIVNPDREYDQGNRPQEGVPYDGHRPGREAYRVLKLMAVWQMTAPGAPMIYYGDEVGMWGATIHNRKAMEWGGRG